MCVGLDLKKIVILEMRRDVLLSMTVGNTLDEGQRKCFYYDENVAQKIYFSTCIGYFLHETL